MRIFVGRVCGRVCLHICVQLTRVVRLETCDRAADCVRPFWALVCLFCDASLLCLGAPFGPFTSQPLQLQFLAARLSPLA